jgi:predicted signal transduction protein with EAL and GGDEF domain
VARCTTRTPIREHHELSLRITLSIGVAARHPGESGAQWHARADAALYRAKRRGRNRVVVARHLQIATQAESPETSEVAPTPATNRG